MDAGFVEWVRARAPRPSDAQCAAFAGEIAGDHSWYKHLPLMAPGEPFFVYPNPYGCSVRLLDEERDPLWPSPFRDVIDNPEATWLGDQLRIDLRPDDRLGPRVPSVTQAFKGQRSADLRADYGCWAYWNHGRPEDSRADHVAQAEVSLRAWGDDGEPIRVPIDLLEAGLVYLTGTVSGFLGGGKDDEYAALAAAFDLPPAEDERRRQFDELIKAMHRVRDLVW